MRRRSITAFVLALIASLLVVVFGYVFSIILAIIVGLSDKMDSIFENVYSIANILMYVGVLVALVGSGFSFTKARVTAILLTIATVLMSIYPILTAYVVFVIGGTEAFFIVVLMFIPIIMIAVGALLAFLAKARPKLIPTEDIEIKG